MPLFDDPMYVALPAGHRLCHTADLSMSDLAVEPWMLATGRTCPDARLFLRACHEAGFEPRIAFQNDDYGAILGFVAAGVGVALVPDIVTRAVRGDVVIRELDPAPPARPISVQPPAGYRSPAAGAMLAVLQEVRDAWVRPPRARGPDRRRQRVTQAPGSSVSFSIDRGQLAAATSAIVTCSTTRRRLARTAIHTRGSAGGAPG